MDAEKRIILNLSEHDAEMLVWLVDGNNAFEDLATELHAQLDGARN